MSDPAVLLAALQLGDSAFPTGGFAFSWGLEGLLADNLIETGADVAELIDEQLRLRWNLMDRVLLRDAFATTELDGLVSLDHLAEAATLSEPLRLGSRRAGRGLLGVFARLGYARAGAYRAMAEIDEVLGHLSVAQGLVYREAGLAPATAELLSGWTLATGLVGAAIRLGIVGHLDAQKILTDIRPVLGRLLAAAVPARSAIANFTPLIDIALARNPNRHLRMFAT